MSDKKGKAPEKKRRTSKGKSVRKSAPKRARVRRAAKKEVPKPETVAKVKPKEIAPEGPVPFPVVGARHSGSIQVRKARGFSKSEMSSAGLSTISAQRWGVPVDLRRRSLLQENADKLKAWLRGSRSAAKAATSRTSRARKKD